jgi:uncharacterized membrane protein YhaH (DUF805 family)
MHWFTTPIFEQYMDFDGRTGRKAYWMFILFYVIGAIIVELIGESMGIAYLGDVYALALLLPVLGISVRRLHDVNKSGWWVLLNVIPLLGFLILLYFYVQPGDAGPNQYGSPMGTMGAPVPEDAPTPTDAAFQTDNSVAGEEASAPEENKEQM